ncbi:MAG: C25 family cysteine peptidase, partial [Anaerolineales bacterium]|nr:C25 family cysteine peptidase [Anaerolineales bacterium]
MIGPQASLASPRELPDPKPRVTLTPGGLRVFWHAPAPQILTDPEGLTHVAVPGYELLDLPGVPQLPFSSVLVSLPPDSNPVLQVLSASETKQNLLTPLVLGDQPAGVKRDSAGQIIGGAFTDATKETFSVDQAAILEPIGVVRGVHLARLSFYPVLPHGNTLRVTSSLEVEVDFGPVLQGSVSVESTLDPLHDLLRAAVVNPEQMQIDGKNQLSTTQYRELQANGASTVAVEVSSRGITDISGAEIAATGVTVSSFDRSKLSLTRDGSNIAYQWLGDDDDTLEPGEIIRFFADPRFSRWSTTDTYILNLDGSPGVNMGPGEVSGGEPGTPWAELFFEDNEIYTPGCYCAPIPAGRDGDRWVWDHLLYVEPLPGEDPVPLSKDYKFHLTGVDNSQESTLSIWLIGQTDFILSPDHKINILVNGHYLGSRQWDGKNAYETVLSFSGSFLNEGENTLTITLPGIDGIPLDGIWLDAFSIRYALTNNIAVGESIGFLGVDHGSSYMITLSSPELLAYDITDPEQPLFLTNTSGNQITILDPNDGVDHNYWVTTNSGIQSADNLRLLKQLTASPGFGGAEYVIVAPTEFIPSLDPLVGMHRSNGLEVIVEDVQAIYDVYSGGRPLPSAIKDYLENAYFNWNLRPLYVLLVGDGTHDPKNYRATSSTTFIPPFLEDVDPWAGETAADNRY